MWKLTWVTAVLAVGCASVGSTIEGEVVFVNDADGNMQKGEEALESKNFPEASRYFEFVRTKYPYLDAAKVAELRLADTDYEREHYVEARDRYQNFVRLHPTHPKVDYAAYRAAITHYRDIPSDFFLLPPSTEKDQAEVRSALSALNDFLRVYPKSELVPEAVKLVDEVKRRLAQHELYVADFYAARDRWPAVIGRLQVVAKNYQGVGFDEKVFFGLYDAHRKLKDEVSARAALAAYVDVNPDDAGAKRAKKILESGPPVATPSDAGR